MYSHIRITKVSPSNDLGFITWFGPTALALLVNAGQIKNSGFFSWLPLDLTFVSLVLVLISIIHARLKNGPAAPMVVAPIIMWVLLAPAIAINPRAVTDSPLIATLYGVTLPLSLAPFYVLRSHEQRRAFIWALSAISLLAVATGLTLNRTFATTDTDRLVLQGAETIGSARLALQASLCLLLLALMPRVRLAARFFLFAGVIVTSFFAIATGSRGPIVAALGAVLTAIMFAPVFRKHRLLAIIASAVMATSVVLFVTGRNSDGASRVLGVFLGEGDNSTSTRQYLWGYAVRLIGDKPFGIGWGGFQDIHGTYPHNLVLELAVSTGVIVAGAILLFIAVSVIRAIRRASNAVDACMLALFVYALINSLVSSDFNGNRLLFVCLFAAWVTRSTIIAGETSSTTSSIRTSYVNRRYTISSESHPGVSK